jgi:catechol 2,3-dioxygenase-like lactoylglutathione lyase family enzyme
MPGDTNGAVFNHVGHCVTDLDRSRRFYEELLGFEVDRVLTVPDSPSDRLLQIEPPVGLTAMYLRKDGLVLELLRFDREGNPPARRRPLNEPGLTHLSVSVDDVAATAARAAGLGGEVLEATDIGVAVFVRDPDGQLIELLPMAYRRSLEA